MNGADGSGGGGTFGQGTSWVPLSIATLGAGLAGAGRQGSPASQLGMSLVGPMLTYYANQAATADERQRRRAIEDELMQRQRQMDTQQEQYRWADLALKSGQYEPSLTESPGATPLKFGQQTMYLRQTPQAGLDPYISLIRNMYGDQAAEQAKQSLASVPSRSIAPFVQAMLPALERGQERKQAEELAGTVQQYSGYTVPDTGQEWGTTGPMPPVFTPAQSAWYQQAIRSFPEARTQALKAINERLAEITPDAGGMGTITPGPNEQMTRRVRQEPGKRPVVETTISPTPWQERTAQADSATIKAQATALAQRPDVTKIKGLMSEGARVKFDVALTDAINRGTPDSLSTAAGMLDMATDPAKYNLQQMQAQWMMEHPQMLEKYMQSLAGGRDKETFYMKQIATINENKRYAGNHVYDPKTGQITEPNRALMQLEQQEALSWQQLAAANPQDFLDEAFWNLKILNRWDDKTATQARRDFAARHGIKLPGPAGAAASPAQPGAPTGPPKPPATPGAGQQSSLPFGMDEIIAATAAEAQIDPRLLQAVMETESDFNPSAVSAKGATGAMQLMPPTQADYRVKNPMAQGESTRAGARHLKKLLTDYKGNLDLALAAYNAGPTAVETYGGVPRFPETQQYIQKVKARMAQLAGGRG